MIATTNSANTKFWIDVIRTICIYGVVLFLLVTAFVVQQKAVLGSVDQPIWLFFMMPILIAALLGGLWCGLFTTLLVAVSTIWLIPSDNALSLIVFENRVQWFILLACGVLVSLLSDFLQSTRRAAISQYHELAFELERLRKSEHYFQTTFDYAAVGMAFVDLDGRWLAVNQSFSDIVGYSQTELQSKSFQELTHPDDIATDLQYMQRLLELEMPQYSLDKRYFHKTGKIVWVRLSVALTWREETKPGHFIAVIEEISERKRAEAALFASEASYRQLFESMINGYAHCQMVFVNGEASDFVFLKVNPAFVSLTKLTNVINKKISEVLPDFLATNHEMLAIFDKVAKGEATQKFEAYIVPLQLWFNISVFSAKQAEFVVIFDDITERKTAELSLSRSEALKRAILDSVTAHIAVIDQQGNILDVNQPWRHFAEQTQLCVNEPFGRCSPGVNYLETCRDSLCCFSDDAERSYKGIQAVLNGTAPLFQMEFACRSATEERWLAMNVTPLGKEKQGVVIAHVDITESKLAQQALAMIQADLSATLQAIPDLLFEIDLTGIYINVKASQAHLLFAPPEQLLGRSIQDVLPDDAAETVMAAISSANQRGSDYGRIINLPIQGADYYFELSVARKFHTDAQSPQFVVLSRNITERCATEMALREQTLHLAASNAELQRFNKIMIGRELTMIELKKTVNDLSIKLDMPPPYPMAFLGENDPHSAENRQARP